MNNERFQKLMTDRFEKTLSVMGNKKAEYASDVDVLINFKKAGLKSNQSPEKALKGFLLKHETSLDDIIDKLDRGILPTKELIDEKLGDIFNYTLLLEGLIIERLENAK